MIETTHRPIGPLRDHLFLSYAGEDGALAEWLTLKLVSEGYRVWCDRVKLLGGESYPKDISTAIRERTFRFVPLLSHYSIAKENPLKERTLAHAVSRSVTRSLSSRSMLTESNPTNWTSNRRTWSTLHFTRVGRGVSANSSRASTNLCTKRRAFWTARGVPVVVGRSLRDGPR